MGAFITASEHFVCVIGRIEANGTKQEDKDGRLSYCFNTRVPQPDIRCRYYMPNICPVFLGKP